MRGFEELPSDWNRILVWTNGIGEQHQSVEFVVNGQPIQKGNIIKSKWGAYHDATKGISEWVDMVRSAGRIAMNNGYGKRVAAQQKAKGREQQHIWTDRLPIFTGPVQVDVVFVRERLKSHPKTFTPHHTKKPDTDKLLRGILDGLTGVVYNDDSQVVDTHARKRYALPGERPGARIIVHDNVPPPDEWTP